MIRFTRLWKLVCFVVLTTTLAVACQKEATSIEEIANAKAPKNLQTLSTDIAAIESVNDAATIDYCGATSTSSLKAYYKISGTDHTSEVGNVVIGNDKDYLYITYNLSAGNTWFLKSVAAYVGTNPESLIVGSTNNKKVDFADLPIQQTVTGVNVKTYTLKLPLPSSDNFKLIVYANAKDGSTNGNVWGQGSVLSLNGAEVKDGAMSISYTKQVCQEEMTCGYSQGYWFAKPQTVWCSDVTFGHLTVSQTAGRALWVPRRSDLAKAFFQASAIQLSQKCFAADKVIPAAIAADYNFLSTVLSGVSYADLQNGVTPAGVDMNAVKTAASNLSAWICANHCDATDTDACNTSL